MAQLVTKKLQDTVKKISNIADLLLKEDGHENFEIDSITLSTKDGTNRLVDCHWERINGEWVKVCTPRR